MTTQENPHTISQEVLGFFSNLSKDQADEFLKKSPFGETEGLNYIVSAMILSKERDEIAKIFGISKDATTTICSWAMANIIVIPMLENEE